MKIVAVLLAVLLIAGCGISRLSSRQLERVAKDWSLSIRASQVIPVYPLTEDLQPGDVFLVQTPVEDQIRVYRDRGFLPLENQLTRLSVAGYPAFYSQWPGVDGAGAVAPPRLWQFPHGAGAGDSDFARAPLVAFPSYSFAVSRSGGLNVALPVQGVPIGLNLLDAASATGTITMKDAYTYGLPAQVLQQALEEWVAGNGAYVRQFAPPLPAAQDSKGAKPFFLRVVNRVYLVKTVDVSLLANRSGGGGADVGAGKAVELLNLGTEKETTRRFDEVNAIISKANHGVADAVAGELPGGSVKVAMATSRTISLVETFARPLVVGYLAFDFPILAGGRIGPPVATFSQLENRPQATGVPIQYTGCDPNCRVLRTWSKADPANKAALEKWLERFGGSIAIADFLTGDKADLRQRARENLIVQP